MRRHRWRQHRVFPTRQKRIRIRSYFSYFFELTDGSGATMWIGSGYKCSYRALRTVSHTIHKSHTIPATTTAPAAKAATATCNMLHWDSTHCSR